MNTLKFGNGEWYGKKDTILAYNDENSNFKPLPFSFDRDTLATRVNKDGLIETVGSGEPRIDYKDDSKGALLLEPSRTNSITYSEDFSDASWIKSNLTVNSVSENNPLGNKCYKIIGYNNNNLKLLYKNNILTSDATFSVLVKASGYNFALIKAGGGAYRVIFDLVNGTVGNKDTDDGIYSIEDYGNGWYRCSAKFNNMPTNYASVTASATNSIFDKTGNGVDGILLAYTQAEIGSYATSYIPTQGSVVTRNQDSCNNGANEQVINSTEGVFYVDLKKGFTPSSFEYISLSDGTTSNTIRIFFNTSNQIGVVVGDSGVTQVNSTYSNIYSESDNLKVAFKYKANDFSLWVNGQEVITDNSGTVPSVNSLNFGRGDTSSTWYEKTREIKLYNTALTDQELINLTTI